MNMIGFITVWPCGPMDKASDYGSGDSRFESWQGRFFFLLLSPYCILWWKIGHALNSSPPASNFFSVPWHSLDTHHYEYLGSTRIMTTPPQQDSRPSPHILCSGTSCLHRPSTSSSDAAESYALAGDFGKTMTEIKANEVLLACSIGDTAWLKKGLANGSCPNTTNREV